MSENVVIIVQARLGSTRLPGKILKSLNGYPVLEHVLERCAVILGKHNVVCAGVDKPEEAPVRELAEKLGFEFYAGSELDVLARYYHAAKRRGAEWVVRVTSDCPLLDPQVCRGLIEEALRRRADFGITSGWPHGLDCEVMTFELLQRSHFSATSRDDREHVTLWAKRAEGVDRFEFQPEQRIVNLEQYRWVLDYPEDYQFLQCLAQHMDLRPGCPVSYREVLAFLQGHREWLEINRKRIEDWSEIQRRLLSSDNS